MMAPQYKAACRAQNPGLYLKGHAWVKIYETGAGLKFEVHL